MRRPRLLDAFACQGGAGQGYDNAGFDVTAVDIQPQPRNPFPFIQADAVQYIADHGHEYDVIHASPPCQAYSITKHSHNKEHPDLLVPTRDAILGTNKPYIIENVVGAPLKEPMLLCGTMFGLRAFDFDGTELALQRHRLFESNMWLMSAGGCSHDNTQVAGAYGGGSQDRTHAKEVRRGGYTPAKTIREQLLGINWMTLHGLSQSIPPAYTEFIGHQIHDHLKAAV